VPEAARHHGRREEKRIHTAGVKDYGQINDQDASANYLAGEVEA